MSKFHFDRDTMKHTDREKTAIYIVPDISARLFSACEMRGVRSEQSFDSVFASDIKRFHRKRRIRTGQIA